MKNVTIELSQSYWEISDTLEDLDDLYNYLAVSGTDEDLRGLNTAIEVLTKISYALRRLQ